MYSQSGTLNGEAFINCVKVEMIPNLTVVFDTIFEGDSLYVQDDYQFTSGAYHNYFYSQGGCDSFTLIVLEVVPVVKLVDTLSICQGDSILIGGQFRTERGLYADTAYQYMTAYLTGSYLNVQEGSLSHDSMSLNLGDSALIGGMWRTQSGTYCDTMGCGEIQCTTITIDEIEQPECIGSITASTWMLDMNDGSANEFTDLTTDECGNIYVISSTEKFMSKYDNDGQLQWNQNLPFIPSAIDVSTDGTIALTGTYSGTKDFDLGTGTLQMTSSAGSDIFIAKYSTDADLIWANSLDGDAEDWAGDVVIHDNGRVAITGQVYNSITIDLNPDSAAQDLIVYMPCGGCHVNWRKKFVVSFDNEGEYEWSYREEFTASECGNVHDPGQLDFSDNGELIFYHVGCEDGTGSDVYDLAYLSTSGVEKWKKELYGPGVNQRDRSLEVKLDNEGSVYLLATMWFSVSNGWNGVTYEWNEFAAGQTFELDRNYIMKLSSNGEYIWSEKGGYATSYSLYPVQHSVISSMDVKNGIVAIGGDFKRDMCFQPEDSTHILVNPDTAIYPENLTKEGYIATYDATDGSLIDVFQFTGSGNDMVKQVTIDNESNIIYSGSFTGSLDFDLGSGENWHYAGGTRSFFGKLNFSVSAGQESAQFNQLEEEQAQANGSRKGVIGYPTNPTETYYLQVDDEIETADVSVYNLNGRLISQTSIQSTLTELNVRSLADGCYLIFVQTGETIHSLKFLKVSE
ncbi:MAG: T9SS type A sorting domain-containing protein [Flavobacteriales bacterium]